MLPPSGAWCVAVRAGRPSPSHRRGERRHGRVRRARRDAMGRVSSGSRRDPGPQVPRRSGIGGTGGSSGARAAPAGAHVSTFCCGCHRRARRLSCPCSRHRRRGLFRDSLSNILAQLRICVPARAMISSPTLCRLPLDAAYPARRRFGQPSRLRLHLLDGLSAGAEAVFRPGHAIEMRQGGDESQPTP